MPTRNADGKLFPSGGDQTQIIIKHSSYAFAIQK